MKGRGGSSTTGRGGWRAGKRGCTEGASCKPCSKHTQGQRALTQSRASSRPCASQSAGQGRGVWAVSRELLSVCVDFVCILCMCMRECVCVCWMPGRGGKQGWRAQEVGGAGGAEAAAQGRTLFYRVDGKGGHIRSSHPFNPVIPSHQPLHSLPPSSFHRPHRPCRPFCPHRPCRPFRPHRPSRPHHHSHPHRPSHPHHHSPPRP